MTGKAFSVYVLCLQLVYSCLCHFMLSHETDSASLHSRQLLFFLVPSTFLPIKLFEFLAALLLILFYFNFFFGNLLLAISKYHCVLHDAIGQSPTQFSALSSDETSSAEESRSVRVLPWLKSRKLCNILLLSLCCNLILGHNHIEIVC